MPLFLKGCPAQDRNHLEADGRFSNGLFIRSILDLLLEPGIFPLSCHPCQLGSP